MMKMVTDFKKSLYLSQRQTTVISNWSVETMVISCWSTETMLVDGNCWLVQMQLSQAGVSQVNLHSQLV